ncbi:asparagine synthase (glutamine-hydrolyzing) [Aneurinibacillus sp. Ricciae_BoGa-3]|uniref:asparagine synthase (glutamine-hydrolyzing) n=1 Tax=Aneurinibacillus sp. Ricciae_BoGa-3 TaxID=3022697 RepID=UPI00234231AC|nr:asparagine synthase (glutamine-hydrolyzing) [Aneurinibacillus sp. Ricciae_BoGa-3]WCK56048.1 asparagine synthase (glutamine-hydrolyzing) [Aneurinibacillus sp. Ricciae_BoGa-3]
MCGFVTIYDKRGQQVSSDLLETMTRIIAHRGPDDEGLHVDGHIGMGFRRLSIIDLKQGAQPFHNEEGDISLTFNGEIYNFLELRAWLQEKGRIFRTSSDTEVIMRLYEEVGQECTQYLRGMFAFTIYDRRNGILFGARDHFGIKPLYWTETDKGFIFASEIKSIVADPSIKRDVDITSFYHYLTYQYVPEPATMFQNIYKLRAGEQFTVKNDVLTITPYYTIAFHPQDRPLSHFVEETLAVLEDSVSTHRISDVPRGAFLSGGIDSSALAALLHRMEGTKTFSVGFEMPGYSELDLARKTADFLGTEHYEIKVNAVEYLAALPAIVWHQDEPVADPSAVGLYFVSKLASEHVKVVFSGEGADEFFGGYNIYREPHGLRHFNKMPGWLRLILRAFADRLPEGMRGKSYIERGTTSLEKRFYGNAKIFTDEAKQQIIHDQLLQETPYEEASSVTAHLYEEAGMYDDVTKMQYVDIHTWLRGDILAKADKMSMAHSLELRVPFVDTKVFEVAASIPTRHKTAARTTKYALRQAMKGILPQDVQGRKKLGFPVPTRVWLRSEWYGWAKELIANAQVDRYINKSAVQAMLDEHRIGKRDNSRKLWVLLIFMLWHQIYVEAKVEASPMARASV